MPFPKGVSGNPSGRPRRLPQAIDAILKAREYSAEMLDFMVQATRNPRVPLWRRAAIAFDIWCIGQGRPAQTTALTGAAGGPLAVEHTLASLMQSVRSRSDLDVPILPRSMIVSPLTVTAPEIPDRVPAAALAIEPAPGSDEAGVSEDEGRRVRNAELDASPGSGPVPLNKQCLFLPRLPSGPPSQSGLLARSAEAPFSS